MSSAHKLLRFLRLIHLYIGVFIAPALIFFAFTGALQTFSLHETTRGSNYKPPAWAVVLAQIHKKQTPVVPVRKPCRLVFRGLVFLGAGGPLKKRRSRQPQHRPKHPRQAAKPHPNPTTPCL